MYHNAPWEEGAEEASLGNPLLDVKLLGKAGISKAARAFRHCARYDTAASLSVFMSRVFHFVSYDVGALQPYD